MIIRPRCRAQRRKLDAKPAHASDQAWTRLERRRLGAAQDNDTLGCDMHDAVDSVRGLVLEEPRAVRKRQLDLLVIDDKASLLPRPSHQQFTPEVDLAARQPCPCPLRITRGAQHPQPHHLDVAT
jgi:hypothetical protein